MITAAEIHQRAALTENKGPFTLYRADTHGTESEVVANVSEDFARSVMLALEAKPHHQGYWYRVPGQQPS